MRQFKGVTVRNTKPLRDKIFGRLVHSWGRRVLRTFMDGDSWRQPLHRAKDDQSVAVMIEADPDSWVEEKDNILHIHFEGDDLYWIPVFMGSFKREWFRRVHRNPRQKRRAKK
jgi:hypothetical protein